ncbi:hypothetical protein L4C54_23755 [Vibrio lamellibrachiae]|uniref:hypothetical protein n=1 Tax=Vibrio lamellibrachiae TaxID=2910253 RepID=UPI003D1499E0
MAANNPELLTAILTSIGIAAPILLGGQETLEKHLTELEKSLFRDFSSNSVEGAWFLLFIVLTSNMKAQVCFPFYLLSSLL